MKFKCNILFRKTKLEVDVNESGQVKKHSVDPQQASVNLLNTNQSLCSLFEGYNVTDVF